MSREISFETLFNFAPDAYFILDLKGKIIDGNSAAEKLVGYKKAELVGKNITKLSLVPLNQLPAVVARLTAYAAGMTQGGIEFTLIRKDRSEVEIEIFSTLISMENKKLTLNIARDITERNKNVTELKIHKKNLEKLVKERTAELEKLIAELLKKNKKLEHFNELFVGREFRIKELKDMIKSLEKENEKLRK